MRGLILVDKILGQFGFRGCLVAELDEGDVGELELAVLA